MSYALADICQIFPNNFFIDLTSPCHKNWFNKPHNYTKIIDSKDLKNRDFSVSNETQNNCLFKVYVDMMH